MTISPMIARLDEHTMWVELHHRCAALLSYACLTQRTRSASGSNSPAMACTRNTSTRTFPSAACSRAVATSRANRNTRIEAKYTRRGVRRGHSEAYSAKSLWKGRNALRYCVLPPSFGPDVISSILLYWRCQISSELCISSPTHLLFSHRSVRRRSVASAQVKNDRRIRRLL
jgi:hypothetical protein